MKIGTAFVTLAILKLGCDQKELAKKLGVSQTQITKWKKGEHISVHMRAKFRKLLNINDSDPVLILAFGSEENLAKWNLINRYILDELDENSETGYTTAQGSAFVDGDGFDYSLLALVEAGASFPKEFPEELVKVVELIDELDEYEDEDEWATACEFIDNVFEKSPSVGLFYDFWRSFIDVYGFYAAYLSPLADPANALYDLHEQVFEFEDELFELALIKGFSSSFDGLPLYQEFKDNNYETIVKKVKKINELARQGGVFEKVDYLKILTADGDELAHSAEREALGFNETPMPLELKLEILKETKKTQAILYVICRKLGITEEELVYALDE